ncbi:enamine deaminase RidA (YjgF/YER057c/UK114 family) [Comamonas sp. BIGb0152]|uniref:RidA family protein n=1 Tax=Comamonas sp. BIGb0152 TaxID=2940601 RepID=UPI00216905FA|nr:RidA family protein [Comamonas sp. BIGb0152]MCS4294838.1 enamine deaminase RidA (YjgF/YER057c/UK114 family) [Comamonas sp. BIGb0152]
MPPSPRTAFSTWMTLSAAAAAIVTLAGCAQSASGDNRSPSVVRHPIPGSDFPISSAVEIPPTATTVYLSGQVPPVVDASKPANDPAAYGGDTRAQTMGVLNTIDKQLKAMGLTMKDVVKMQVYLVGDPAKDNKMDFAGFMQGYTQFFGTAEQPNLPSRSAFQVAALANPAWYVEIEVTAVRMPK